MQADDPNLLVAIARIYDGNHRDLADVAHALSQYDEAFSDCRWQHFQLVLGTIGDSTGTGGTTTYLRQQLLSRFLPELVNFRTKLFR